MLEMPLNFGKFFRQQTAAERYAAMNVRSDVAQAAVKMASDQRSGPTIHLVGEALPESEIVIVMIEGRYEKRRGLLVLTTRRVLFFGHEYRGGPLLEMPLVELGPAGKSVRGTRLELRTTDGIAVVDQTLGTSASIFAEALDRQLEAPTAEVRRDPLELLAEIRALHASGVMTDEEYAAEKARLIDRL